MIYVKRYRGQERWIKCFFWPYGSYPRRDGKTPLSSYPHLRRFHAPEKRFLQAKASPSRLLSCPTRPRPLEKGEGHHLFRDQERVSIAEREAEKNRRSLQDIQQQVTLSLSTTMGYRFTKPKGCPLAGGTTNIRNSARGSTPDQHALEETSSDHLILRDHVSKLYKEVRRLQSRVQSLEDQTSRWANRELGSRPRLQTSWVLGECIDSGWEGIEGSGGWGNEQRNHLTFRRLDLKSAGPSARSRDERGNN
jgi:hypothetical protein